jgi:hypothetical protein
VRGRDQTVDPSVLLDEQTPQAGSGPVRGEEVSMADVYAVFGTMLALGMAFPGLLTGSWLLFPQAVGRSRARIVATPFRCFFLGVGSVLVMAIPVTILNALPLGLAKLAAALLVFGAFGVATLGAAAVAVELGDRIRVQAAPSLSGIGAVVRGAIILELAAVFPLVGWFLLIPAVLLTGFGAGVFALLRWRPRPAVAGRQDAAAQA